MFKLTHPPIRALGFALVLLLSSAPAAAGTLTIPNTFSANTKAVAAEVNANFTAAKTAVDDNDSRIVALEARVSTLEGELTALQGQLVTVLALAPFLNLDPNVLNGLTGPHVIFEGVNVHIRSGTGTTDDGGTLTGLGNLVVGYNEPPAGLAAGERAGSHNLIVGREHRYLNFGGLVAGLENTISGEEASVSGGQLNTASGLVASVSGGANNTASGPGASVSAGNSNTASGSTASVSGGARHTARGQRASVSGGYNNTASGDDSSVSGGFQNTAYGLRASVSGGEGNTASGSMASVSGGRRCTVTSTDAWGVGDSTITVGCPTTN